MYRNPNADDFPLDDPYADYEARFDPLATDRQARRKRKPRPADAVKPTAPDTTADDARGLEGGLTTTYQPSRYEEEFLADSLRPFFERRLIADVISAVQGGKEASVYCATAHPDVTAETGETLFAVKVYRPRKFRSLRNDSAYREGREILTGDGKAVQNKDHRTMRALHKKTDYGVQVAHTSWLMHEFTTLQTLYNAGAAVPRPVAVDMNAILMGYVGDEDGAAPRLADIKLSGAQARPLLTEVIRNLEVLLQHGWIHGDLSAYNILYFDGAITLIDFPQVTNAERNGRAADILRRDVTRVCEYFARMGVTCDANAIFYRLWHQYGEESARRHILNVTDWLETDSDT